MIAPRVVPPVGPYLPSLEGLSRTLLYLGPTLSLLGGVGHLLLDGPHRYGILQDAFEVAVLGVLPVLFLVFLGWFDRRAYRREQYPRLLVWTLVGITGSMLLTGTLLADTLFYGGLSGELAPKLLIGLNTGALFGHVVGWEEIRIKRAVRRATTAEAKAESSALEQARLAFLNRILRHHVMNGLNLIMGRLENLREGATAAEAETIDLVVERCQLMRAYVDDIQSIGEVISGEIDPTERDLGQILRAEVETTRGEHPEADIDATIPDTLPVLATTHLGSVFAEVLENAVKHNHREHPQVSVSVRERGWRVVVEVADDGPGMPDELKRAYFERGQLGERSLGEGLGLYLAETILRSAGGRIELTDNTPRGTRVRIELKRAPTSVLGAHAEGDPDPARTATVPTQDASNPLEPVHRS